MKEILQRVRSYYFDFKKHHPDLFPIKIDQKEMVLKMSLFFTLSEDFAKGFWQNFAYLSNDSNNSAFNLYNQHKVKIDAKDKSSIVWMFSIYLVWCEEKPLQKAYDYNPSKFTKAINLEENEERKLRKEYDEKHKKAA